MRGGGGEGLREGGEGGSESSLRLYWECSPRR